MMPKELVERISGAECDFAPAEAVDTARAAFLANLTELLKINLPDECLKDESPKGRMLFYAGAIANFPGEIPEDTLRGAHLGMMFPSNRAIISRLLHGPGNVTHWGVPADYGV